MRIRRDISHLRAFAEIVRSPGKCSDTCLDPQEVLYEIGNATGAFVYFVDHLTDTLSVIDPMAHALAQTAAKLPPQTLSVISRFVFSPVTVPRPNASYSP